MFVSENASIPNFLAPNDLTAFPDLEITFAGVHNLLLKIDTTKSAGPDGIPNLFLKRYSEWCAQYLTVIFRRSLETASVPVIWKTANVVPVFKAGNRQLIPNYRPISLTCTSCKLLEYIIHKHIFQYLSQNGITRHQHGFRAGFSTVTQLLEFTHDIASELNNRGQIDAIFIDYSKAFDKVCHNKLLHKLRTLIGNGPLLSWIEDYLRSRSQFVTFNHGRSTGVQVLSGVPEGSVLGQPLFIIYINDVAKITSGTPVKMRLYADDCVFVL